LLVTPLVSSAKPSTRSKHPGQTFARSRWTFGRRSSGLGRGHSADRARQAPGRRILASGKARRSLSTNGTSSPTKPRHDERIQDNDPQLLPFSFLAPIVFVSAKTGDRVTRIYEQGLQIMVERRKSLTVAEMEKFIKAVQTARSKEWRRAS